MPKAKLIPAGTILISQPFLKDKYFSRTVVLLVENNHQGSFGFVLNRYKHHGSSTPDTIGNNSRFKAHYGGPMDNELLFIVHTRPDLIEGSLHINNGLYWQGNLKTAFDLVEKNEIKPSEISFFIGYSGWDENQLQQEINEGTWILHQPSKDLIFMPHINNMWKKALHELGGEYKTMSNFPIDPQLN